MIPFRDFVVVTPDQMRLLHALAEGGGGVAPVALPTKKGLSEAERQGLVACFRNVVKLTDKGARFIELDAALPTEANTDKLPMVSAGYVRHRLGLSEYALHQMVEDGRFPPPAQGGRTLGTSFWLAQTIEDFAAPEPIRRGRPRRRR